MLMARSGLRHGLTVSGGTTSSKYLFNAHFFLPTRQREYENEFDSVYDHFM